MKHQVVYVLSTNYAGSHFLALQLASHTRCISLGEVHRARRHKKDLTCLCHSCDSDEICPVFRGIAGNGGIDVYDRLLENLCDHAPDVQTLIDNSKKTRWASRFLELDTYERRYIHLIRDPRALIRRWMIGYELAEKRKTRRRMARRSWRNAWDILRGSEANVYLWKWVYQNRLISDFLRDNALDSKVVTYHDLVFDPDGILSALMGWLGHEYEPEQKEYWRFKHHGSVKSEYMPEAEANLTRIFDQRWREFLDDATQKFALEHRAVQRYLADLDLRLDVDKGLMLAT